MDETAERVTRRSHADDGQRNSGVRYTTNVKSGQEKIGG
jgi:hypothetical protein